MEKIKLYGEEMCSYNIAQKLNEVIDELNERKGKQVNAGDKQALSLSDVNVSFAEFLRQHQQADEVQKAAAHVLFSEFCSAYEL